MYLSLDVGTTVAKAVLFDKLGQEILVCERICPVLYPEPGAVEQNPMEIRDAVMGVLQDVFASPYRDRIQVLGVSTQGGSMIPVRRDGSPTHNLITWMDQRAVSIVKQWSQIGLSQEIRDKSGWWIEAGLPISTIEWLRRNRPQEFEQTDFFLSLNDYLAFLLTGRFVTNPSCAGEMLLVNRKTGHWDPELCAIVGIHRDQLSEIQPAEAAIAPLAGPVRKALGLDREIPVVNGGQDHTLEALAVGLTHRGKGLLACGTAWVINGVSDSGNLEDIPSGMGLNFHVTPGQWIISQYLGCFGAVMEWWVQRFWSSPETSERSRLFAEANDRMKTGDWDPQGLLYLPLGGGKQMDTMRSTGSFLGADLTHGKEHLTQALMEGIAFEVRWALEKLEQRGGGIEELWMIGGAARSSVWPQMMADVLGIPVLISNYSHGPALGAAMVAAVSQGDFPDYESCRQVFSIEYTVRETDSVRHQILTKRFNRFKTVSELIKNQMLDV